MNTPEFKNYIKQVKSNANQLAESFKSRGYKLITDGTDNHIVLMSVIDKGLTGSKVEKTLEELNITVNKNTIIGDTSAMTPGGIRMGSPSVTTRGYLEQDMQEVARFIDEAIKISLSIQSKTGKKLVDYNKGVADSSEIV